MKYFPFGSPLTVIRASNSLRSSGVIRKQTVWLRFLSLSNPLITNPPCTPYPAVQPVLRKQEFSDLIYHRLLHFRKAHVPTKDGGLTDKLSIYAINYACSYNLHSESKISFITEYKTIHDRVRRYIYHPSAILQKLQIKEGEIFPCSNCGEPINILKMKAAWDNNACPFCGQHIRH